MPAAHASAFALKTPSPTPLSVAWSGCGMGIPAASWLRVPPAGACGYSESSTTAQARPSGKGCCSSLMKRRFIGNATSTPSRLAITFHRRILCHSSTVSVTNMYAISALMSGPVM